MRILASISCAVILYGCNLSANPLLEISEGQFKNLFDDSFEKFVLQGSQPTCREKIFFPELVKAQYKPNAVIKPVEQQIQQCLDSIQKKAAEAGIKDNITHDNIKDTRVKERAIKLGAIPQK